MKIPCVGSDEAIKQGCFCVVYEGEAYYNIDCPLHGRIIKLQEYDNGDMLDLVQSIKNRCDILLNLTSYEGFQTVCPTLLEDISQDAQVLVDDYCVKD